MALKRKLPDFDGPYNLAHGPTRHFVAIFKGPSPVEAGRKIDRQTAVGP